jgi:hypothetical protein
LLRDPWGGGFKLKSPSLFQSLKVFFVFSLRLKAELSDLLKNKKALRNAWAFNLGGEKGSQYQLFIPLIINHM